MKTVKNIMGCVAILLSTLVLLLSFGHDGFAWPVRTSETTQNLNGVAYGNGVFVAVGAAGIIQNSPDGINWTKATPLPSNQQVALNGVAYGNGLFVAAGNYGGIFTSPDGKTWTLRTSLLSAQTLYGVAYGNGVFVAVGSNNGSQVYSLVFTSSDGKTWTTPNSGGALKSLTGVAYGNGVFVAMGGGVYGGTGASSSGGYDLTSPDGKTWTIQKVGNTQQLNGIAYGNGLFAAVGNNGAILTSPDGVTWTSQASGTTQALNGAAYCNGFLVALGNNGAILTSPDGATWTSRPSGTTQALYGAACDNGVFVAVGGGGVILTPYVVTGSVVDAATGKPIPNAAVTVTDIYDNVVVTTLTNASGQFFAAGPLSPGTYSVTASRRIWATITPSQLFSVSDASPNASASTIYLEIQPGAVSIPLSTGWNFVSTPLQPPDPTPSTVLLDLTSNLVAVWGWNATSQSWQVYAPSLSVSSLAAIQSGPGYWIYMSSPDFLCVSGTAGPSTMILSPGWNLIGFNGSSSQAVSAALSGLSGNWLALWTWSNNQWYAALPSGAQLASFPTMTNFQPTMAYWINSTVSTGD
jgi:hypothetical protein